MPCGPAAFAQAVDSGALQRQQQQALPVPPPPTEPPPLVAPPPAPTSTPDESEVRIFVSAFKLDSPSALLTDSQLNQILGKFIGRDDSFKDIDAATALVADALHKRGYAFARVLVPRQEVSGGVVELEIMPGKLYGLKGGEPDIQVKPQGKTRIDEKLVAATVAAPLSDPVALNISELQRGLLLLNDLPGVQGSGVLVPGKEPGTLGLGIDVREGPLFGGWVDADDYGSRATGSDRVAADLHLNDPSGHGDAGELYLAKSSGTDSATASYTDPLGVSGLSGHLSASYLHYHVLSEFSALDATGASTWLSAGVSYPLLRARDGNLYWTATVDYKHLLDKAAGTEIDSRQSGSASGGVRGDRLFSGGKGSLVYLATVTAGRLDRAGNAADELQDSLTRRSQGNYAILRTSDSWLEQLNPRFSLSAALQMQFSTRNLDTSEKLYLGGPHGVRAYPIEEAGSDQGQILSLEGRYLAVNSPKLGGQIWTPFVLFDAGHATLNEKLWNEWNAGDPNLRNSYWLEGAGVGLRAQIARVLQIEFIGARKIGDNPGASATGHDADGRSEKTRFWFIATFAF
jgi:hemolysin activation/secretion protein